MGIYGGVAERRRTSGCGNLEEGRMEDDSSEVPGGMIDQYVSTRLNRERRKLKKYSITDDDRLLQPSISGK